MCSLQCNECGQYVDWEDKYFPYLCDGCFSSINNKERSKCWVYANDATGNLP